MLVLLKRISAGWLVYNLRLGAIAHSGYGASCTRFYTLLRTTFIVFRPERVCCLRMRLLAGIIISQRGE